MGVGPLPSIAVTLSDPTLHPSVLAIQSDASDPPLLMGEWLQECGLSLVLVRAWLGEPIPTRVPDGVQGVLVLGGPANAHDDVAGPWLPDVRALLGDAVAEDVPVLGLCLGGQLLAAALGGRVELSSNVEIGLSYVERTDAGMSDPVISSIAAPSDRVPAVQWHQDHITQLPDDAVVLLTNPVCAVQAFRVGDSAYGFQMHPEVAADAFDDWTAPDDEALVRSGRSFAEAAAEVRAADHELTTAWRPMARAWADLVWAYATDRR
jgi:GMP synthase (glutamine-hydrolysing)